jgi:hypothetical protein
MKTQHSQSAIVILVFAASTVALQGANIFVTTLGETIGRDGCSLQDAINSANSDSTLEIYSYDFETHATQIVQSQCEQGTPGGNTIVLPVGAMFQLTQIADDVNNPTGPAAMPMITSSITIQANGATLEWTGQTNARLFSVGSTGSLTVQNAYIKGFRAHGGDSISGGGGGGLGAGGAIYVLAGRLVLENCTFDSNGAIGGYGGIQADVLGGGGGGMGGDGTAPAGTTSFLVCGGGGGGGGSRGGGDTGCLLSSLGFIGGGGGGTLFDAVDDQGGFDCGGNGGVNSGNGQDASCPGGGGGGGGSITLLSSGNGGNGDYGGGGGGGGNAGGNGGNSKFGGGGGGGQTATLGGTSGGNGGFGGGGGGAADGILAGHPGSGGKFGGNAVGPNGGGGAALGGAVFNDSGSVLIQNSTFANNFVTRGSGGGAGFAGAADNGSDAGGAIFSRNGSLEVDNATASGNQGTGTGAGIVVVEDGLPTSFVLNDTILANNGDQECFVRGAVTTSGSAGNLIMSNGSGGNFAPCDPNPVTNVDPNLGTLRVNTPGNTPTMAISKASSAWNTGAGALLQNPNDALLQADQRGEPRPSMGGPDIGAFELCVDRFLNVCTLPPQTLNTQPLTVSVSPVVAGTANPSGTVSELEKSVVFVQTAPNPGFSFLNWTGPVSDPNSAFTSTVILENAVAVVANYVSGTTVLGGGILVKSGLQNQRVWPISITDAGVVVAHNTEMTSFTLTQTLGTACSPVLPITPFLVGDISPGNSTTVNVVIDFTGCAATARFTAQATFSANGGGVTGSMSRTNQIQ